MKRKFSAFAVAAVAAVSCAFGFTACNQSNSGNNPENGGNSSENGQQQEVWGEVYTVKAAYATAQSLGYEGSLEEFIKSISGKDGVNGTNGADGVNGKDGKDGKDGVNGINGKDGEDGVGISNVEIDQSGNLIVTLTNSQTIDCGKVSVGGDNIVYNYCQHSYGEWTVGFAPTCTSMGYKSRTCETCGDIDYEFASPVAHNFTVKSSNSEKHTVYCSACGGTFEGTHSLNTDGDCTSCGEHIEGLGFVLNEDGNSYSVIGSGTCVTTEIIVPSTYKNMPVTGIYRLSVMRFNILAKLTIPVTVTYIGPAPGESGAPFFDCTALKDIYYGGSIDQWNEIEKSDNWNADLKNCTVHCEDGDISV